MVFSIFNVVVPFVSFSVALCAMQSSLFVRNAVVVGTEGIEPSRLSAHDPKSTSVPAVRIISEIRHREYPNMSNQRMTRETLSAWAEGFLRDCRARDLSAHTVKYYRAAPSVYGYGLFEFADGIQQARCVD